MDPQVHQRVKAFEDVILAVFHSLGNALPASVTHKDESLGDGQIMVTFPRLGQYVIVDYRVRVRTIGGFRMVPGYCVGHLKNVPGGRSHPDEIEDVDVLVTVSLRDAVQAFVSTFTGSVIDGAFQR